MSDKVAVLLFFFVCGLIFYANQTASLKILTCVHGNTLKRVVAEERDMNKFLKFSTERGLYTCQERVMTRSEWGEIKSTLSRVYGQGF